MPAELNMAKKSKTVVNPVVNFIIPSNDWTFLSGKQLEKHHIELLAVMIAKYNVGKTEARHFSTREWKYTPDQADRCFDSARKLIIKMVQKRLTT